MEKLRIIPFEGEHLDSVDLRPYDKESLARWPDAKEYASNIRKAGPCFTGVINNEIVGMGGWVELWNGVVETWLITGNLTNKHRLSFHRLIKNSLKILIQTTNVHRVQAIVYQYHEVAIKWIERLGFKEEGLMENYGPDGSNFLRYALIIKRGT